MKTELTIVNNLMTKYNLTKKDLFSFCICAVNFLEYYLEECMGDVMMSCPGRYYGANSDNPRAVAGALTGEKKEEGWTDEEQFAYYMRSIQGILADDLDNEDLSHFLEEFQRFEKVYKRGILVPLMLGCLVEDYDDSKFYDEDYIASITNAENLVLHKAHKEDNEAEYKEYREREAARLAQEVKERKNDEDFSVVLVSSVSVSHLEKNFKQYNEKYYPDRNYKIIPLHRPNLMIIQTGGKSIEDVRDTILTIVKQSIIIAGHDTQELIRPVEDVFNVLPKELKDNKVTHVVTYI